MEQNKKYYAVEVKCGHVTRKYYILKTFGVVASSKKEAAAIARYIPRVKHDHKDAIRSVREISYEEFLEIQEINKNDDYLKVHSKQEQNKYCMNLDEELLKEENYKKTVKNNRKERLDYKKKKDIALRREEKFLRAFSY